MTFDEIHANYNAQMERQTQERNIFRDQQLRDKRNGITPRKDTVYTGFTVDYDGITKDIVQALKDEFGFNDSQAQFISAEVYDRYHAYFGDVISGARNLGNLLIQWESLKKN